MGGPPCCAASANGSKKKIAIVVPRVIIRVHIVICNLPTGTPQRVRAMKSKICGAYKGKSFVDGQASVESLIGANRKFCELNGEFKNGIYRKFKRTVVADNPTFRALSD